MFQKAFFFLAGAKNLLNTMERETSKKIRDRIDDVKSNYKKNVNVSVKHFVLFRKALVNNQALFVKHLKFACQAGCS